MKKVKKEDFWLKTLTGEDTHNREESLWIT